jgi:hypothetical protein
LKYPKERGQTLENIGICSDFLNRTQIAQKLRMRIENEITSNSKASAQQREQPLESKEKLLNC